MLALARWSDAERDGDRVLRSNSWSCVSSYVGKNPLVSWRLKYTRHQGPPALAQELHAWLFQVTVTFWFGTSFASPSETHSHPSQY
jgi:hypothetical protein